MPESVQLVLGLAVNVGVVYMIIRVEHAKIKKHAEWEKKLSDWEKDNPPTPTNRPI